MSGITPGSSQHRAVVKSMGENLKIASNTKKDLKKVMKETSNVKDIREKTIAYATLSRNVTGLQALKQRLLDDKAGLSEAYKLKGGKKERIKDILKFCWGPKAKLNRELKQLNHVQRSLEKKMAKLDPEKFVQREKTIISKEKVEKNALKAELKQLKNDYKANRKALKKFESFVKMKPYSESKPKNPKTATKHFHAFKPREHQILNGLSSYRRIDNELVSKKPDHKRVQTHMDALRREMKAELPKFKAELATMEQEIRMLGSPKKLGYLEI